ncbi:MAG: Mu transposase C-terminal domain-containing protein [Novosphingobium sp.]|nr:Mu transposase C-terminal domain-containing protein [Novosphingobium sp.]
MATRVASWWYTAAELAALGLPGLPDDVRKLRDLAKTAGWVERTTDDGVPLSRRRTARGGGTEFHANLLPVPVQEALTQLHNQPASPIAANDKSDGEAEAWAWYDLQSASIKAKAEKRLAILIEVEALVDGGATKTNAIQAVARKRDVSPRSIAEWFSLVAAAPRRHWLPRLAPQYKGGGKEVSIDAEAWQILRSDYLRPERPAFMACYNRLLEDYAAPRGITLPCAKTLKRRLEREVSELIKTSQRDGKEALRRMIPPQMRTVADLHAMQAVNIDGHTFDVFVMTEDNRIIRPVMVGIQDIYSRKLLSWRIGETENTKLARLTFADLFRKWGIPEVAVLDNGRAFASKALTGGAKTRFRFMIKEYEATGVLTTLGIKTHWTMPYRGSSKPIERAWRDLCEDIAKHPAVSGAYTGNKPDAKPENYRDRAIPMAEFEAHVARRIAAHNARLGRATEMARGGSFDAAFAASYASRPIGKASEVELRLALLEAQVRRCDRQHGSVTLHGNRYWSAELLELRGKNVTVRFDPENLRSDAHIYLTTGQYVGAAPVQNKTGFLDQEGAKRRARSEAGIKKLERELREKQDLLNAAKVAELLSGHSEPTPKPEPGASRIVRRHGQTAAQLKPKPQATSEAFENPFIDNFTAGAARLRVVE